jgi:hypothetical protein
LRARIQYRNLSDREIANDTVDGRPIAVTCCPICWSAAVEDSHRTTAMGTGWIAMVRS